MADAEPRELPGLAEACAGLEVGRAVIVPNPSPMTYGIVATSPRAVNLLKGRPLEQNVAISLHNQAEWQQVATGFDVPARTLPRLVVMLRRRLSLLVPLRDGAPRPDWINPAVRNGFLAVFNGHWTATAQLWDQFPRLYGSSANRTGQQPATTAVEALASFGDDAPVIDGDRRRDLSRTHAASTMLKVARDGTFALHRHGAHDLGLGLAPKAFLQQLTAS